MPGEFVAPGGQRAPQLRRVVELAVIDEDEAPSLRLGHHGLASVLGVDDGETVVEQGGVFVPVGPALIRAPGDHGVSHGGEVQKSDVPPQIDRSGDGTHGSHLITQYPAKKQKAYEDVVCLGAGGPVYAVIR